MSTGIGDQLARVLLDHREVIGQTLRNLVEQGLVSDVVKDEILGHPTLPEESLAVRSEALRDRADMDRDEARGR